MSEIVHVFVAREEDVPAGGEIYPAQRRAEIAGCGNERVRAQKLAVWKLLERALKETMGTDPSSLRFTLEKSGKWVADGVQFSLAHSHGLVAVALSELSDRERFSRPFAENILTEREKGMPLFADAAERCALWTKKEAIFKCMGGAVFRPDTIEHDALPAVTVGIAAGEEKFFLSVAGSALGEPVYHFGGNIRSAT